MLARETIPSNNTQAASSDLSKRTNEPPKRGFDSLYARLRHLEQRIERLEVANSTLRRDVYRVEKRHQRQSIVPTLKEHSPEDSQQAFAGLFG